MSTEDKGYRVLPLGELQWWSLEVISGTIIGVGIGVYAGVSNLGLTLTLLAGGAAFLGVFAVGILLRRVSHEGAIYVNAPPQRVFDALLRNAGRSTLLRAMWGVTLRVERPAEALRTGASIDATYSVGGDALSISGARKGELTLSVVEVKPPHRLAQQASNKFRGRATRGSGETILEPHNGGTRVTERTRLVMPLNASHFIGAVYARLVLARSTRSFLLLLKKDAEGTGPR